MIADKNLDQIDENPGSEYLNTEQNQERPQPVSTQEPLNNGPIISQEAIEKFKLGNVNLQILVDDIKRIMPYVQQLCSPKCNKLSKGTRL